jgi:hypothetical protein
VANGLSSSLWHFAMILATDFVVQWNGCPVSFHSSMKTVSRSAGCSLLGKSTIRWKQGLGRTRSNGSFHPAGPVPVCRPWAHADSRPQVSFDGARERIRHAGPAPQAATPGLVTAVEGVFQDRENGEG